MEASEILLEQYNNLISKADALKLENKLERLKFYMRKQKILKLTVPTVTKNNVDKRVSKEK